MAFELDDEPEARSALSLPGAVLLSTIPRDTIAALFGDAVPLGRLTLPNGSPVFVRAKAVVDVDDPISTNPVGTESWLVFSMGPRARRLATRETRAVLASIWQELGLNPNDHGI